MNTLCCSDICERRSECARHTMNNEGIHSVIDFYHYGSGQLSSNGLYREYHWCGKRGNWERFEPITHQWIKLYEQAPPINKDVEVKVIVNDEERIYVNRLTPLMNGKYVWEYCDYDNDGDEVVAWRRLTPLGFGTP